MSFFVLFSKHCIIRSCVFLNFEPNQQTKQAYNLKCCNLLISTEPQKDKKHQRIQGFQPRSTLKKPITLIFYSLYFNFQTYYSNFQIYYSNFKIYYSIFQIYYSNFQIYCSDSLSIKISHKRQKKMIIEFTLLI